jgi:hypothetical protein
MSGFGSRYHPLTATPTIVLFLLFAFLGFGVQYLPIPGAVSLAVLPIDIIHSFMIGRLLGMLPVSIGVVSQYSALVTYYLVALVMGYVFHSLMGSSDPI